MKKLYLDDERFPKTDGWEIVRTYEENLEWIKLNGVPDYVSFDHDLADIKYDPKTTKQSFTYREKSGLDAAKFLGQYCIGARLKRHGNDSKRDQRFPASLLAIRVRSGSWDDGSHFPWKPKDSWTEQNHRKAGSAPVCGCRLSPR